MRSAGQTVNLHDASNGMQSTIFHGLPDLAVSKAKPTQESL
jgi:hypothetical protein